MGIRGIVDSDLLQTGPKVIASAAAIVIPDQTNFIRITGNVTIGTISLPIGNALFRGPLYLVNTDSSVGVTDTSGNIQLGTTLTRYKIFTLLYDPTTSKWYPSAVS